MGATVLDVAAVLVAVSLVSILGLINTISIVDVGLDQAQN